MDGFGYFSFPELKSYIGYFENDKKNGFGIVYWYKEKKCFVGFWEENKQNGIGKFISDNKVRYGKWNDGKKIEKYENDGDFENKMNEYEKKYLFFFNMDYESLGNYLQNITNID